MLAMVEYFSTPSFTPDETDGCGFGGRIRIVLKHSIYELRRSKGLNLNVVRWLSYSLQLHTNKIKQKQTNSILK